MTPEQPSIVMMGVVPVTWRVRVCHFMFRTGPGQIEDIGWSLMSGFGLSNLDLNRSAVDNFDLSNTRVDEDLALDTAVDR